MLIKYRINTGVSLYFFLVIKKNSIMEKTIPEIVMKGLWKYVNVSGYAIRKEIPTRSFDLFSPKTVEIVEILSILSPWLSLRSIKFAAIDMLMKNKRPKWTGKMAFWSKNLKPSHKSIKELSDIVNLEISSNLFILKGFIEYRL